METTTLTLHEALRSRCGLHVWIIGEIIKWKKCNCVLKRIFGTLSGQQHKIQGICAQKFLP